MSAATGRGVSAEQLQGTLRVLASGLLADGHPLQAIKCYVAMLGQSMLPADEAATRLTLGQLLMQHTLNAQDAKQQLQKAEMLVMPLPGQHLLKCEVLAALSAAHQLLGESDFQRRCLTKGLEQHKDPSANSADRQCLVEWAIYFHLHLAESMASSGQPEEALQQIEYAAGLAESQGLLQQQVLCGLLQLQLAILHLDRSEVKDIKDSLADLLEQLEQEQEQAASAMAEDLQSPQLSSAQLLYMKLHFAVLCMAAHLQRGKEAGSDKQPSAEQPLEEQMDELLQQLLQAQQPGGQQQQQERLPYDWLPLPVMTATAHLLAAMAAKPAGKQKQAHARLASGLAVLDGHLAGLLGDKAATSSTTGTYAAQRELRACLALRLLLLETRQQLNLLRSDYAAARVDAAESISMLSRFPNLLSSLAHVVHMQSGLYAQGVGAHAAAAAHFMAAAVDSEQQGLLQLAADARSLAAVCHVAEGTAQSVSLAREVLGDITADGDLSLSYSSRCLRHIAAGLVEQSGHSVSSEQRSDAKQQLSRALKMAHTHLHNHQVVSQLLLMMGPLQAMAGDASGARQMLSSSVRLSHGAADLPAQVKGLGLLQPMLVAAGEDEEEAKNRNYKARKEEELSTRIQEAESDAQQHRLVLTWGLA